MLYPVLYSAGKEPKGTSREEIIYAKKLYTSAFHPDTGEIQNFVGRMSFQLPGGMLITGGMLSFYRTVPAVVFWQWINQSFNAFVNYTNRNANSELTVNQLGMSYVMATSSAMVAALGCKAYWSRTAGPFMQVCGWKQLTGIIANVTELGLSFEYRDTFHSLLSLPPIASTFQ